ncbi:U4/U6 small nuclear ribonucleoprotein Prp31-like protein [Bienertia sinuspersici]
MATLSASFLSDLDDLSCIDGDDDMIIESSDAINGKNEIESLNFNDDFKFSVSKLQKSKRYHVILHKVDRDLTQVNLEGLLPSATIMVVSLTASTTSGKPLPENVLHEIVEACNCVIDLVNARKEIHDFIESRMVYIAPNLSAVVGSAVAAKLMVVAGGLEALGTRHNCDSVRLLGAKKESLVGFSTQFRVGFIKQTELFQSTPPCLEMNKRACRLLGAKVILAARIDATRGDMSGKIGRTYFKEIREKIEKWQELPPPKIPQPLPQPVPDSKPKKKRGGRRLRKMKERYAITHMKKLSNRVRFGVPEESSLGHGLGVGYGMLV